MAGLSALPYPGWSQGRGLALCCLVLCVGCAAYGVAVAWAGSVSTWQAVARIGGWPVVWGTIICGATLLVRFVRWHMLTVAAGYRLPVLLNLRAYLGGLALSSTPGKLGETYRSVLLWPWGMRPRHSLAAFFADRLSDLIGVAAIGALAGLMAARRLQILELLAAGLMVAAGLAAMLLRRRADGSRPPPGEPPATHAAVRGRFERAWHAIQAPAQAWSQLWTPGRALVCVVFAITAYGAQAVVFCAYARSVLPLLGQAEAAAVYASAILIGAASGLPGGLGAMDAALALQLQDRGANWGEALAVTLCARASTLWFAWLVGLLCLATFTRPGSGPGGQPAGRA